MTKAPIEIKIDQRIRVTRDKTEATEKEWSALIKHAEMMWKKRETDPWNAMVESTQLRRALIEEQLGVMIEIRMKETKMIEANCVIERRHLRDLMLVIIFILKGEERERERVSH